MALKITTVEGIEWNNWGVRDQKRNIIEFANNKKKRKERKRKQKRKLSFIL